MATRTSPRILEPWHRESRDPSTDEESVKRPRELLSRVAPAPLRPAPENREEFLPEMWIG